MRQQQGSVLGVDQGIHCFERDEVFWKALTLCRHVLVYTLQQCSHTQALPVTYTCHLYTYDLYKLPMVQHLSEPMPTKVVHQPKQLVH